MAAHVVWEMPYKEVHYCQKCDVGLCLKDHSEIYDTKVNYWDLCLTPNIAATPTHLKA
jgi:hypothetical protein